MADPDDELPDPCQQNIRAGKESCAHVRLLAISAARAAASSDFAEMTRIVDLIYGFCDATCSGRCAEPMAAPSPMVLAPTEGEPAT